jgi:C1A family cysteine protease
MQLATSETEYRPIATELPDFVDLRLSRYGFPPIYDQCWLESCTACAIAAVLAYDIRHRTAETAFEPSRLFLHYNERRRFGGGGAPVFLRNCLTVLAEEGICSESEWPYDPAYANVAPPDSAYRTALARRNFEAVRVARELHQLKSSLAAGFPFVCGISIHYSSLDQQVRRTGVIPLPTASDPRFGVHAIAMIGYEDQRQAFIIRNSQGEAWGDRGHGYLPYAYLLDPQLASIFWVVRTDQRGNAR